MNIAHLLARPHDMSTGEAAPYLEGFASEMAAVGYAQLTIGGYLDAAIHFGGWLQAEGVNLANIDQETVKAFGVHRCQCPGHRGHPYLSPHYVARVERFAGFLAQRGVARLTVGPVAEPSSRLMAFRHWLLQHRGLSSVTIDRHEHLMNQMLPALGADAGQYTAAKVRAVILNQIRGCRPAYAKTFCGALRIYLRFLATNGDCQPGLDHAVPTVAEWKVSSLPRYLDSKQLGLLNAACRKEGPLRRRDRAITLLLLRLGLRAGDIAGMRPADIDWHDATLLVRGKGRRDVRLPLPQDAGDAVLDYLERERPSVAIDRIFLCTNAPFRALPSGVAVSNIVQSVLRKAGIEDPPSRGANLIRHTAATTMLRAGATLDEIGTLLRHKSPDTTAHYAKVDLATLERITQPWPASRRAGRC